MKKNPQQSTKKNQITEIEKKKIEMEIGIDTDAVMTKIMTTKKTIKHEEEQQYLLPNFHQVVLVKIKERDQKRRCKSENCCGPTRRSRCKHGTL